MYATCIAAAIVKGARAPALRCLVVTLVRKEADQSNTSCRNILLGRP